MRRHRIPFLKLPASEPALQQEYLRRITKVICRSRFILGDEVARFEHEFAAYCRAKFCIGLGNGTQALQTALRLSGIQRSMELEVITSPLTASFTVHAIIEAGGRPVFADVSPETLLLDPGSVRRRITSRTAAFLPVHLYGQVCDLQALAVLAEEFSCFIVQDAAQAHGTEFRAASLAAYSDWVAFSFYPTKNLGCLGDGGALVTNRWELAEAARIFRDGGRQNGHIAKVEGINSRLDELQAAILRFHLKHLDQWNLQRKRLAALYDKLLGDLAPDRIRLFGCAAPRQSCHHLYVIRTRQRDALRQFLAKRGIETAVHYETPLHLHPAFRYLGYRKGDFPIAEQATQEICSLPLHPFLSISDVEYVAQQILRFFKQ